MVGGKKGKAGKPSKQAKVPSKKKNKLSVSPQPLGKATLPTVGVERTDAQISADLEEIIRAEVRAAQATRRLIPHPS
jgi:hypothetical protein